MKKIPISSTIITTIVFSMAIGSIIFLGYLVIKLPEPHKYIVQEGYTGWIEVMFDQVDSPPITKEDGVYTYRIPASGKLNTSSPMREGLLSVFYQDKDGGLTETKNIHAVGTRSHSISYADGRREDFPTVVSFFLGTDEQWEIEAEKLKQESEPKP